MTSDEVTPRANAGEGFFRDAPLWRSSLMLFLIYWGVRALLRDVRMAWGSRAFGDLLVDVAFYGALALCVAWYARSQSRSRRSAVLPPAV
jgi:hypothetical protein